MTLEQLRIFVAVAEREHVTQGARDLNLTQSATSAAIAALETRYATKLFDRVGRRIALTEAGRLFLVEARAVLARAAAAEATLFDLAGLECGSLSIAASQTVGNYWLPPILHRYRTLYPKIAIELKICNTLTAADMARAGVVDFAIVEGEICDTSLAIEPVARDELKLVTFPGHPWTRAKPKQADDYRSANWVLREKGSGTRAIFEAVLGQFGVDAAELRIALELPTHEAVAAAVAAGAGVAMLPSLIAEASAGTLAPLDIPLPNRRFLALRREGRHITHAALAFRALLQPGSP
ncbi:MAG TPA: LysR substrate-binding domain-containing protein [Methylosinus sp.]|jgi:DNA-binding transcriptional LysR family regulator|uniref:LysR substrate-binding domain-containing protein n=1 Tax=Methylosinus sp. TaxID=427 RepID=UPI002F92576F